MYEPADGVFIGRPPCAQCGANFHLHNPGSGLHLTTHGEPIDGRTRAKLYDRGVPLVCPEAYRPGTAGDAQRELAAAEASGDPARIFIARGNVQRLAGTRG